MNILPGDRVTMKKAHPCGNRTFTVVRVGADFKLRCEGCGNVLLMPRAKAEKNIRQVKTND